MTGNEDQINETRKLGNALGMSLEQREAFIAVVLYSQALAKRLAEAKKLGVHLHLTTIDTETVNVTVKGLQARARANPTTATLPRSWRLKRAEPRSYRQASCRACKKPVEQLATRDFEATIDPIHDADGDELVVYEHTCPDADSGEGGIS